MVPLRDDNPTRSIAYVTYAIIILNVLAFLYQLSLCAESGLSESCASLSAFFQVWALVPAKLTASFAGKSSGLPFPAWVTLFSSQFLHGGFMHIAGNMLFLWIFGNNVEDKLGHLKYIIFYLGSGALAALTQWFFDTSSVTPCIGASGAIAGVMGAYILRFPQAKILTLVPLGFFITTFQIPAIFFLGFWFLQQAFSGVASLGVETNGGVAYWAHAGGFVFGAVLGTLLGLFADRNSYRR